MTEQAIEQTPAAEPLPEVPLQFRGREIWARMPRPEQLLVWQRTLDKLQNAGPDTNWTASTVMVALERLRKIVDSILVNEADKTWIDDQFLEGSMEFKDLVPLINGVAEKFAELAAEAAPNREARRAKKAGKTATRKAAR
jgi:hypothetical protein